MSSDPSRRQDKPRTITHAVILVGVLALVGLFFFGGDFWTWVRGDPQTTLLEGAEAVEAMEKDLPADDLLASAADARFAISQTSANGDRVGFGRMSLETPDMTALREALVQSSDVPFGPQPAESKIWYPSTVIPWAPTDPLVPDWWKPAYEIPLYRFEFDRQAWLGIDPDGGIVYVFRRY